MLGHNSRKQAGKRVLDRVENGIIRSRFAYHHQRNSPAMRADYINPFVTAVANTFQTMVGCETRRQALARKTGSSSRHEISGIIGLSGNVVGTVVLNLSRELALHAAATMLMTNATRIDESVLDAVGELTNMIAGAAKGRLDDYQLSISLPTVIIGRDHQIRFPSNVQPHFVPFETDWGPLTLEVGLTAVAEPAFAALD